MENNRFKYSNFNKVFGELESVHRVKRGNAGPLIIHSAIILVFLSGVVIYVENRDVWTIPVCIIMPFLLFCLILRHSFSTGHDELRIYRNGFTYQGGKKLQSSSL